MPHKTSVQHYDIHAIDLLPGPKNFLSFLTEQANSSPTLNIPFWQRDYDWGTNQIQSFLSSVTEAVKKQNELYLGTLVFGSHSNYQNQVVIIDGQQRLRSIQNLIILSQFFFKYKDENCSLRLVQGIGDYQVLIQSTEAVYASFSSDDQRTNFSQSNLKNAGFESISPSSWLPLLRFRIIFARFKPDARKRIDPFDLVMSNLFANINRQAKPLDDIDIVKAKLLFRMRQYGLEDESLQLAQEWETARMLQLVPTQSACRELLHGTNLFGGKFDQDLSAIPYDPDTIRVQFSRYILFVEAFARNARNPTDRDRKEILEEGKFGKTFENICNEGTRDSLLSFSKALKTINDIYITHRDFLLLSRRNRPEDIEKPLSSLSDEKRRLLIFQAYVSSGTSRPNWLAHPMLMKLISKLSQIRETNNETLNEILVQLETNLFKHLCDKSSEHTALTARDWFLWRALFDNPKNNLAYDLAVKGCHAMIQAKSSLFTVDSGEDLLAVLRERVRSETSQIMPTSTGADEVEHWVAIERGRSKEKDLVELYQRLDNKAHIAKGLNQSMRNDGILKKAGHLDQYWWPTLQFLAAYSLCGKKWTVADDSLNKRNLSAFLSPLEIFWQTVSCPFVSELAQDRDEQ